MEASELAMQMTLTQAFILADAESVIFSRKTKIPDGAGGSTRTSVPLSNAQTVRIIPASDKVPEVASEDGTHSKPEWTLIGMPSLDMARYDTFPWRGSVWQIAQIHIKPDYEKKGDVILYGGG